MVSYPIPSQSDGALIDENTWNDNVDALNDLNTRVTAAKSAADTAKSTADTAKTTADTAKSTADAAATTNTAQNTRLTALETNQGTRGSLDAIYPEIQNLRGLTLSGTTGNAALGNRLTTVEANQGTRGSNGPIYTEIETLKTQGPGQGAPPDTWANDTLLYGDVIGTRSRNECWWGESVSNGYLTVAATRSTKTFAAADLRFCVTAAGAGSGTFDLKLYVGSGLNNLVEKSFHSGPALVTSAGVKHLTLNNISITKNDYVAIGLICTAFTTSPKLSSTATGAGFQLLIGEIPYSAYKGGQTYPLPATLSIDTSYTRSNQAFWFALA